MKKAAPKGGPDRKGARLRQFRIGTAAVPFRW
jgi:hypothetical protein